MHLLMMYKTVYIFAIELTRINIIKQSSIINEN